MNEFEVQIEQKAGTIKTNFEDIKKELKTVMSAYQNIDVTEDNLQDSKKDLAFLRKIDKSLEDKRKEVKKAYLKTYEDFEISYKELRKIVNEPIEQISSEIKAFDEKRIEEKRIHFLNLYQENIEDFNKYIPFESTLENSWSNVSYKDKDYLYALSEKKLKIRNDIQTIKNLESEIEEELLSIYEKTGNNLNYAVQRNTQYLNDKSKISNQIGTESRVVKIDPPYPTTLIGMLNATSNQVCFIVSIDDEEKIEQYLTFNDIKFRKDYR